MKLWGVRTSECLATYDEHEAKVWALHVAGANDSVLVTGGADARVNLWRDCTMEDEATAAAERSEAAFKGQELANALQVWDSAHSPTRTIAVRSRHGWAEACLGHVPTLPRSYGRQMACI